MAVTAAMEEKEQGKNAGENEGRWNEGEGEERR